MTLLVTSGMTAAQRGAKTPGSLVTGMVQFGNVIQVPQAGEWSSFAVDFPVAILGWKIWSQNGNALASATTEIKVYHSTWPLTTPVECSGTERPKLTATFGNEDFSLTTWTKTSLLLNEALFFELLNFSGPGNALYLGMRLQRL